jgi:hypothetical protein
LEVLGSGVDVSNQPEALSVRLSDPVQDLNYARNSVTLTYDLSGVEHVRLKFAAMEFGDEPHGPKDEGGSEKVENDGVFGPVADFNFDGVAISADGVAWYEVQGLRGLRSDRFTAYDIDLDAAVTGLGLAYNGTFRIRFCQYDDNPAPMDGVSIKAIELLGDGFPPVLHLTMDDNAASPTVTDVAAGHRDQVFLDPGGNPNTSAHSVPGKVGTALSFDGVDDRIDLGTTIDGALSAGHDFSIAFWWNRGAGNNQNFTYIFQKPAENGSLFCVNAYYVPTSDAFTQFYVYRSTTPTDRTLFPSGVTGYGWNHYVFQRRGNTFELLLNGVLVKADTTAGNDRDFSGTSGFMLGGTASSLATGAMDDFRVYDRALFPSEILELATPA